jgi:hypothetical protein
MSKNEVCARGQALQWKEMKKRKKQAEKRNIERREGRNNEIKQES